MAQRKPAIVGQATAKAWLRHELLNERNSLPRTLRKRYSQAAAKKLASHRIFKRSKTVALFLSFGSEIDTHRIVQLAWKAGKNVLIPSTRNGFKKPQLVLYKKGDRLSKMKFGPLELTQKRPSFPLNKIDLMLVPGLGFDGFGARIGYGGGVYDRLIKKTQKCLHLGLFFASQGLERIPVSPLDQPLDGIVTEMGICQNDA